MAFRRDRPFPYRFGGGNHEVVQERRALQMALGRDGRGYNIDDDLLDVEIHAHALALSMIWAVNRRTENQAIPARMLEELTRWEEILKLTPTPSDTVHDRRAAVEAKFRGLTGNAITDTEATARTILGPNYVKVQTVATESATVYWPGVNPGPPGYEWSSNRAAIAVHMTRDGLSDAAVNDLIQRLGLALDAMLPVWMTFQIGVTGGFVVNVGIVGLTLL